MRFDDISAVIAAVQRGSGTLTLHNKKINSEQWESLCKAISENIKLQYCAISCCSVDDEKIRKLSGALLKCAQLKTLSLGQNKMSDQGVEVLVETIKQLPVELLFLCQNNLSDNAIQMIAKALPETMLRSVYLDDFNLENQNRILGGRLVSEEAIKIILENIKKIHHDFDIFKIDSMSQSEMIQYAVANRNKELEAEKKQNQDIAKESRPILQNFGLPRSVIDIIFAPLLGLKREQLKSEQKPTRGANTKRNECSIQRF